MPINIIMPRLGESIHEATITKWLKKEGDSVKRDEALLEVSTDKIDSEIQSSDAGVVVKIFFPAGAKVPVETVIATLEAAGAAAPVRPVPVPVPTPTPVVPPPPVVVPLAPKGDGGRVFASPLVRRMAREESVDLSKVPGTGWKGRITGKDMEGFLKRGETAAPAPPAPAPAPTPVVAPPPVSAGAGTRVVPMTTMRAKIAEHMVMSRRTSAHVTTTHEVDLTSVVAIREREKADYETVYGTKLTYTHFFCAAAVQALKDFPLLNASVDGTNIVYHSFIHLGVAVALPEGLIVPVVKNCEEKSFLGIVRGVNDVAERARTKKLRPDDVQGGTFTITNPGNYGAITFTPIINQPQVAILGIGSLQKRPVVVNDAIAIRSMCNLALSFDHRIVDGLDAEKFMARVKEILTAWTMPIR